MSDQPSYAVDVEAIGPFLERVHACVARALASHGWSRSLPDDHLTRLRSGLAAAEPAPTVVDLAALRRVALDHDLVPLLAEVPFVVGVQVLAAHGLLVRAPHSEPWDHPPAERVGDLLSGLQAAGRAPSLVDAEAVLAGLGVEGLDAARLLVRALVFPRPRQPPLADGWDAAAIAPWLTSRVGLLVSEHEQTDRVRGYSRPIFWALLALVDAWPDDVLDWLFAQALDPRSVDDDDARELLADHPARTQRCCAALTHRTAAVRTAAAGWLADTPVRGGGPDQAAVVAALASAARGARDEQLLDALLEALVAHGERASDHVDRDSLDAAAAKAAAKAPPAALSWLDVDVLPRVSWDDTGTQVPVATVRSWVQRAVKAKVVDPGALLTAVLDGVEPAGRSALAEALLHRWLAAGAPTATRGVLAVVVPGAGERVAALAAGFVRTRATQQGTQAQALVGLLARIDLPVAVQALVEAADSATSARVRKAAIEEVEALAARRGWTVDQVGDRGAPTAGFDASGRMVLDYGPRTFTAVLQPDLTVRVQDDTGTARTSLPPARRSDDPDLVAVARATLAGAKKTVTATGRTQTARLREAMATQRAWTVGAWRRDIAAHPVLGRIATALVWRTDDGRTFRPLDDGTLSDVDDQPVELDDPTVLVTLAHDVLLDDRSAAAWRTHLTDYEVPVAFAQLGDPLPAYDPQATGLTEARGARTTASALHRLADRAGFSRVVDGGVVAAYTRLLTPEVGATLEVRGDAWIGDWAAEVELGVLLVTGPDGPVRLDALPPVLLAELRRDLVTLAG